MLGSWRSHEDYQKFVVSELSQIALINPSALFEYETEISKLFILNLDSLKDILTPLYSHTGRPSNFQPEIFRSFLLMNHFGYTFDYWVDKLTTLSYVLSVALLTLTFQLSLLTMILLIALLS